MSELKSFIVRYNGTFIRVYEESEVDAVIDELMKAVEDASLERDDNQTAIDELQVENFKLKDSIGKLLKAKTEQVMDEVFQKCLIYGDGFVSVEHAMELAAELHHQKYKRCLSLSCEWRSYATFCGMQFIYHNNRGFIKTAEHYTRREFHAWKCMKRWLELAKKFKETMKWILETDRTVPDFRDPYLVNTLFELEVLCSRVLNPEGTRAQYFHDLKTINGMLPIVIGICRSLRLATPLEAIDTEVDSCVR